MTFAVQFRSELEQFAAAVAKHPRGRVTRFEFGVPATEAHLASLEPSFDEDGGLMDSEDEWAPFPENIVALATVFDGVRLDWEWREGENKSRTKHSLELPSLVDHQELKTAGIYELELSWPLVLNCTAADVVVNPGLDGKGELNVFEKDSGYIKGESCTLPEVLSLLMDYLGLPGWEVAAYEEERAEEDDLHVLEQAEGLATAIRTELKLPIPTFRARWSG